LVRWAHYAQEGDGTREKKVWKVEMSVKNQRYGERVTNGWVCMAHPEVMCFDKSGKAGSTPKYDRQDPQNKSVGIAYMLKGDDGASNTDPFATAPTATNQCHPVVTDRQRIYWFYQRVVTRTQTDGGDVREEIVEAMLGATTHR